MRGVVVLVLIGAVVSVGALGADGAEGEYPVCEVSDAPDLAGECESLGLRVPGRLPVRASCAVPRGAGEWHPASDHEHGDEPPGWAGEWSCAEFGWPVVFGGDEQTPGENAYKHNAFKGYSWTATADSGEPIDLYLRAHMQTNPFGRIARFHSYELYAALDGAVVGFWQGWLDFGQSPDHRDSFADNYLWNITRKYSPANHIAGYGPDENPYYVRSYSGREFWYSQQATPDGWDPVVVFNVYDPSTYYEAGEQATADDPETGQPTGDYGLDRRVTIRWIAGGSRVETVAGYPYLKRNLSDPRGWFCATPRGEITSSGSKECAAGSLPQYISPEMPTIGAYSGNGSKYHNVWACPECRLPN